MKGLILINAYFSAPVYEHQQRRIKEELERLGVETDVRRNDFFPAAIENGALKCELDYDFCVYLDKDKYVAEMLEKTGMRLFNSCEAIAACDDKMRTAIRLAGLGVDMPRTLPGLLCYTPAETVRDATLDRIGRALGYPLIVKASHGSMGRDVYKADSREELKSIAEKVKCSPHLFQEYVSSSEGRDLRVIVVGGKALGGMERVSSSDFRSNIGAGGRGRPFGIDGETAGLCERIADALGLDFCGIDLLFGEHGFKLCEVNSNAFFQGFETATGIDVAGELAKHIVAKIGRTESIR